MNVLLGLAVVLVVTAVTVTSMLMVRRRAPEGSYFADGDRASGVFGVLDRDVPGEPCGLTRSSGVKCCR